MKTDFEKQLDEILNTHHEKYIQPYLKERDKVKMLEATLREIKWKYPFIDIGIPSEYSQFTIIR